MPASYAHYRFGKLALSALPGPMRQSIGRFRRLYDLGLQGPDFFFYYNPLMSTPVGDLGQKYHAMSGIDFFSQACRAADTEAARVYLWGLLGHYCLDSICHPFVSRLDAAGEAGHVALESEFDRYLMAADGIAQPHTYDVSRFIRPTRGEAVTAAAFFPPATAGNVHGAVRRMGMALRFLAGKNRKATRRLLQTVRPSFQDHLIPEEAAEQFARLDSELLARFNMALKDYPGLLMELEEHRKTGEPLGENFAAVFG